MLLWYKVKYILGTRYGEILIYADNEDNAKKVAEIQVRHSLGGRGKFEILSIGEERETRDAFMEELKKYEVKNS